MKINYIVLKILIVILTFFILFQTQSNANNITDINMDVYIDSNGTAYITEVWNTYLNQGTEGYRPYTNLGNSKISNFSVSDETGTSYKTLSYWNVNSSFNDKSYKCGIHNISNGVELCWGISKYGSNTYTLKYTINNFVTKYTDSDGIYFNFLNLDQSVGNANINIHSDFEFTSNNSKIWAFGNDGTINFKDGSIVLNSNGKLSSSQYMVALIKINNNLFTTNNISSKSFEDIYNSNINDIQPTSFIKSNPTKILLKSFLLLGIMTTPYILIILVLLFRKRRSTHITSYAPLDLGPKIANHEIHYFREIPCDGDIYLAYWIMSKYKILKKNDCKNALISSLLLRYIQKDYIKIVKTEKGLFGSNYTIDITNLYNITIDNTLDKYFIHILKQASGKNNILEAKEFETWCKKRFLTFNKFFEDVDEYEESALLRKSLLTETTKECKHKTIITRHISPSLRNEVIKIFGLKKFLLNYSLISSRESIEVNLWEDYLIFAQLLGIAKKVENQLKKLYPDFNKISKIITDSTMQYTRTLAYNINYIAINETNRYNKELRRISNQSSSNDYNHNSGSGGNSFSSGGTSSGGSSGGGFR